MQYEIVPTVHITTGIFDLNEFLKRQEQTTVKKIILHIPAHAQVKIVHLQQEAYDLECIIHADAYARVDLRSIVTVTTPTITHHTFIAQIQGVGASIQGVIAYSLIGDAHYYVTTRQEHYAPHGNSSMKVRGLLQEQALSDYRSTIFVAPMAVHTIAVQEHKTLLMGSAARSISIPSLEALTHEVHCKHGSASGQLDAQQLYYMQARGISYQRARHMLMEVFFTALLGYENDHDIQLLMRSNELY